MLYVPSDVYHSSKLSTKIKIYQKWQFSHVASLAQRKKVPSSFTNISVQVSSRKDIIVQSVQCAKDTITSPNYFISYTSPNTLYELAKWTETIRRIDIFTFICTLIMTWWKFCSIVPNPSWGGAIHRNSQVATITNNEANAIFIDERKINELIIGSIKEEVEAD